MFPWPKRILPSQTDVPITSAMLAKPRRSLGAFSRASVKLMLILLHSVSLRSPARPPHAFQLPFRSDVRTLRTIIPSSRPLLCFDFSFLGIFPFTFPFLLLPFILVIVLQPSITFLSPWRHLELPETPCWVFLTPMVTNFTSLAISHSLFDLGL